MGRMRKERRGDDPTRWVRAACGGWPFAGVEGYSYNFSGLSVEGKDEETKGKERWEAYIKKGDRRIANGTFDLPVWAV